VAQKFPYSTSLKSSSGYEIRKSLDFRECRNFAGITISISPKGNLEGADKGEENLGDIWIKIRDDPIVRRGKEAMISILDSLGA